MVNTPWLDQKVAREKLEEHIAKFLYKVVQTPEDSEGRKIALGLKVSAGLGKTGTALRCIAAQGTDILRTGHILFYVPTLALAERAQRDFAKLNSGLPSMVLRGRDAINPNASDGEQEADRKMCKRSDLAKRIASSVVSVTKALCRVEGPNEEQVYSDCAFDCAYLKQSEHHDNSVVFLAHSYLVVPPPLEGSVSLRIIDEKCWPSLAETCQISMANWVHSPDWQNTDGIDKKYTNLRYDVLKWVDTNENIPVNLRRDGIKKKDLKKLIDMETKQLSKLNLNPQMSLATLQEQIGHVDKKAGEQAIVRKRIWELLAKTYDQESTERLSLWKHTENPTEFLTLKAHIMHELKGDAPILMMDADLDEAIVERLSPGAQIVTLCAQSQADIIQVSDLTMSTYSLVSKSGADDRRKKLAKIIKREVSNAKGQKVLVVATTAVLNAMYEDEDTAFEAPVNSGTPPSLHGATARWFGPSMLGLNDYEEYTTIILIGRLQTHVAAVEDDLRAMFGDTGTPLKFAEKSRLSRTEGYIQLNGQALTPKKVQVQTHPDLRGTTLLKQTREAQSEQAVARLRLISPNGNKRVILISNVPLPGLPVDKLVSFEALAHDVPEYQISNSYRRLKGAIFPTEGEPIAGLRVSKSGLPQDAPHTFKTKTSGATFRESLSTEEVFKILRHIVDDRQVAATRVELKRKGGGQSVPAIVFTDEHSAVEKARSLWPDLTCEITSWQNDICPAACCEEADVIENLR